MIATFELQNAVPFTVRAGEPHSVEGGLGTSGDKPNFFSAGNRADDFSRQVYPVFVVGKERSASRDLFLDFCQDIGMAMTDKHRP